MTYSEKLKDQRWQKKRLDLLEAAGWKCQSRCCNNSNPNPTLAVHHRVYLRGHSPWEYEPWAYQVLCDECHQYEQDCMETAHSELAKTDDLITLCCRVARISDRETKEMLCSQLLSLLAVADERVISSIIPVIMALTELRVVAFAQGRDMKALKHAETTVA